MWGERKRSRVGKEKSMKKSHNSKNGDREKRKAFHVVKAIRYRTHYY